MSKCELLEDDGGRADIKSGDVITTDGGILGLGHAGVIDVRKDCIVVIEVFAAPDGSVHVMETDICDFMDRYEAQDREVFISRPKQTPGTTNAEWQKKLKGVVEYMKSKVCNRYPVWAFILDALFHLPDVWYCSDLVMEAFRRQGIEIEISLNLWDASDDRDTRDFMFMKRGEAVRRYGERDGLRYLRGFEAPASFISDLSENGARPAPTGNPLALLSGNAAKISPGSGCGCEGHDLEEMVYEQLWQKEISRLSSLIDIHYNLGNELILKAAQS